ncbi:MAG: DUF6288 domain-containing protein [Pirellulaceae bacterium]
MRVFRISLLGCLLGLVAASSAMAQVHYYPETRFPWTQRADSGEDAEVPGWFYNLGITGLRAELVEDEPRALLVRYVFADTPASGQVEVGDWIVGVNEADFATEHRNGYGEAVFGGDGPIAEFAAALESAQSDTADGRLVLRLRRDGETREVTIDVGQDYGAYSETFPENCPKSQRVLDDLLEYLVAQQREDGSFGDAVHNTFAPLALLGSGEARYLEAVERNVRYHCRATRADDRRRFDLINWDYMAAALVMSEYYLATEAEWVLPELQQVYDHLHGGQYVRMSQINPRARETDPGDFPRGHQDAYGVWGHNPGFEGYGPIAMLTGQGALAYALMQRCGIEVDAKRQDAALEFLHRGTGANGYVWYKDQIGGGPEGWADMGRTGAAGIANRLARFPGNRYQERALAHARVIGAHPQSFPDTHGSPPMGMAYTALAANIDPESFRLLMDANRWWFTLAQCHDGTFYYQPNRDNAGYGGDSRLTASCVVAFIYTIPRHSLVMTGKSWDEERE